MLEVNNIRQNIDQVKKALAKKYITNEQMDMIDDIVRLDDERKSTQTEQDRTLATINQLSKEIGDMYKSGRADEAEKLKSRVAMLKAGAAEFEEKQRNIKAKLEDYLLQIPNTPSDIVPVGKTPEDNLVFKLGQESLPELPATAIPHWELAEKYDLFNLNLGVKITGAGFPVYTGYGAKLQRALINFFLDEASAAGYTEVIPPLLVNEDSGRGTGNLPDKEGQMYYVEKDDLYLIPTAEVPVTNLYRDEIIDYKNLPIKNCAYTPCFRREAGSYGAHVRGLNRVHQFDKIEIVQVQTPDKSYQTLDEMLSHVEGLLIKLELPYRILRLCGGDMSFSSALTYDFEVYSAAQKKWLEVSSVTNFETFQSNRMKLRYRDEEGKINLAHTLNGSALALARIVAALLENNQTEDGIVIPEVLRPYTRFDKIV
ncbi:MAG TPA: serine--tRNA ligase [Saprospiraceae bacterium]|mgnify:CR=1 FL=1|nr:serine--tRNA ligase [Saprospiraceae bacterium]MCB9328132.1 serine--tRNA ligase [Lewinellaceae bacterium]HPK09402.1 serine--tRNA ligase [Saprospiraceae bacterium]HPQ20250.1 serine--tRNA ligase [Saprospiraceae bacterium]